MTKLYNEYKISDLPWENYSSGIYKVALSEFNGCNLSAVVLDNLELSKYDYIGDSYLSSMNMLQYFILDDYLYIKFPNLTKYADSTLKFGLSDPQSISILGDGIQKLIIESRSNNSTYITDSDGNKLTECYESNAPYNRIWFIDSSLGLVNVNNCGVSIAYFIPTSG